MHEDLDIKGLLNDKINDYKQNKDTLEHYKKEVEEENNIIKNIMMSENITEFSTDEGVKAKLSTQKRESFLEDKLLKKLKDLNATSAIKTVEIIDYDELENLIYNNKLDASELTDCKQIKEVLVLKVK